MKKFFILLCIFQTIFSIKQIETERTIWQPWTINHTQQWEKIEQQELGPSYFRRNEYFENIDELIARDKNWLELCKRISLIYKQPIIFPDLGFAIIRKTDQTLIGTIRIKLTNQPGILSFGYGLRPEVRNDKFGTEIIKAFISYINELIGTQQPIFKTETNKDEFLAKWYTEGKKEHPNFDHLLTFFNEKTCLLQRITGSVDVNNPASLMILIRNSMQPFAIECTKYIFSDDTLFFSCDFLLQYPLTYNSCNEIENLANAILSRNHIQIYNAYDRLKKLFYIDNNWTYIQLSRAEKAHIKPSSKTILYYDCVTIKNSISHITDSPYCFMQ